MIDALIPSGICWHCEETQADQNYWICKGCWVSVRRLKGADSEQGLTALYAYQGALETLLYRAKNPLEPAIYKTLLDTPFELAEGAVFVPIPTPWHRRFRRRGCQTSCLAELLARRFGGRVEQALKRVRAHRRQASLDGAARRALPEDTFELRRALSDQEQIVLVDDVMTTGTTMERAVSAIDHPHVDRFVVARVL